MADALVALAETVMAIGGGAQWNRSRLTRQDALPR